MTAAHVHLLLNHFPITGGVLALLLLAWGWVRRNDTVVRAACALFAIIAALTVVTFLTGEPAEHVLERGGNLARDARPLVEEHEEAGEFALVLYSVLGLASLYTLVRYARRAVPRWLSTVLLVVALVTVGAAARVGWLGGPISHKELRSGTSVPAAPARPESD